MNKKLFAGERFLLEEDTGFWEILSGRVEVYATTQHGGNRHFHQCYLVEEGEGEAVFPLGDGSLAAPFGRQGRRYAAALEGQECAVGGANR